MSEEVGTSINESSQLNFSKSMFITPSYRYLRMYQQSGGTNVTISTAGGETSVFEIPPRVFNFARSYLSFTLTPVAGGAQYDNVFFKDCLCPIQKIEVYTQNGVKLDEIQYVAEFTKLIWKPETSYEEYKTFPIFSNNTYMGQFLMRSNNLTDSEAAYRPSSSTNNAFGSDINYDEPQYIEIGTANTADPVLKIRFPLRMLYYTLLSLDKDIYFPTTIYIRITWSQSTKIAYRFDEGAAPGNKALYNNGAAITNAINLTNLYLFLAVEQDERAINYVKGSVEKGNFSTLYAHVIGSKLNTGAVADSSTISIKLTGADGLKLCKVIWAYFVNNNTNNSSYESSLINGVNADFTTKLRKFHTELNGKYLQDYDLNVDEFEPYLFQKDRLEGSVIMSGNMYYYNFTWIDSFISTLPYHKEKDIIFNNEVGIPLTTDKKYDIVVTSQNNAQYTVYIYAITQRMLSISPLAVQVV